MSTEQATLVAVGVLIGLMIGLGVMSLRDYFRIHDAEVMRQDDEAEGEDDE